MSGQKLNRAAKEKNVLLGLVGLYLKTGKPIGSNTLKENGFDHLSSATIRNYFAKLEEDGYLLQHHASGGRVPTDLAFKLYALNFHDEKEVSKRDADFIESILEKETKLVSAYLMKTIEALSELTGCAALLLAPRFDQDFIKKVQLLQLDSQRVLCAITTDFGMVHTEVLFTPKEFNLMEIQEIENYFALRLQAKQAHISNSLIEQFALRAYNEVILRHVVHYTNFEQQDIYRTGFSKLLQYSEFQDVSSLASSLSLFENTGTLRSLLKECFQNQKLQFWIGRDLTSYIQESIPTCLIAIPYMVNQKVIGTLAILGPQRIEYREIFGLLKQFANKLSSTLTQSLYRHKISYRQPETSRIDLKSNSSFSYENTTRFYLENQQH